jgi:hypothetical protein
MSCLYFLCMSRLSTLCLSSLSLHVHVRPPILQQKWETFAETRRVTNWPGQQSRSHLSPPKVSHQTETLDNQIFLFTEMFSPNSKVEFRYETTVLKQQLAVLISRSTFILKLHVLYFYPAYNILVCLCLFFIYIVITYVTTHVKYCLLQH